MEIFVLGLVTGAVSGIVAGKGKRIVKAAAKGYLAVSERTKELTANVREDFRDAVEEARYERDHEAELREELELRDSAVDTEAAQDEVESKPARANRKHGAASGAAAAKSRGNGDTMSDATTSG